jgi:thiol:disulfide interchange protein
MRKQQTKQEQQSSRSQVPAKGADQQAQKNVHGEGNYAASKQYNDATREFAQSGRVEEAAKAAEPRSDADALQMQAAEAEGKRHSKGEDPALNRKSSELAPDVSRAPKPGEQE